jgi:hypothetical protein
MWSRAVAASARAATSAVRAPLRGLATTPGPYAIMVAVTIKPERRKEFLDVMHKDAVGSRTEEECLRFDLLSDEKDPNKFYFYEYVTLACCT